MATTTMHGHHDQLDPVRGDDGHSVAPPQLDDVLFGPAGDEIKALVASGDKDAAQALVRRLTGCGAQEAEDLIARLDLQINPQAYRGVSRGAGMAAAPTGSKAILAIIALVVVVLVVLAIVQAG
jgi:hypothetical protein